MKPPRGPRPGEADERERAVLRRASRVAGALAVGVLALAGASGFMGLRSDFPALGSLAALTGLVSPVIGYRLYAWLRERIPAGASHAARCAGFLRATELALAVGAGIALFGIVAYCLSAVFAALIGVVTHMILVGAVWPTPERLETFFHVASGPAEETTP